MVPGPNRGEGGAPPPLKRAWPLPPLSRGEARPSLNSARLIAPSCREAASKPSTPGHAPLLAAPAAASSLRSLEKTSAGGIRRGREREIRGRERLCTSPKSARPHPDSPPSIAPSGIFACIEHTSPDPPVRNPLPQIHATYPLSPPFALSARSCWSAAARTHPPSPPFSTFCSVCAILLVCCCARSFQAAASREAASAASAAASTSPLATSSTACTYVERTAHEVWTVWSLLSPLLPLSP